MFTGIITAVGEIVRVEPRGAVTRLAIACPYVAASIDTGASIACSGVCLTVVRRGEESGRQVFEADLGGETLAVTTAAEWTVGRRLNLERAARVGDELGGHIVSGHVDGVAVLRERADLGTTAKFAFEAPANLARFIAQKGSVTLDGVSLTVNGVAGRRFDCLLIPHTLAVTTFGERRAGDRVNLEVDLMARYVARLNEPV
ncbi:MAG: riboflavin synthase [Bauldia sp.]